MVDCGFPGAVLQGQRLVTFGMISCRSDVLFGARPPHAKHLLPRITHGRSFLDRSSGHDAPPPEKHVVGPCLSYREPLRFLFDARMGNRNRREGKSVALAQCFQSGNWFLAEGTIVINKADLLSCEIGLPAQFLRDVLDHDVGSRPIRSQQWKVPGENGAVLRVPLGHIPS